VKETGMPSGAASGALSSWRVRGVVLIVVSGLTILIWLAAKTYTEYTWDCVWCESENVFLIDE
jgi:hypothetical protein